MKQTVKIVEDEEVLQTTTCTPKDIDRDPVKRKEAFQAELDSFDRLEVMESVQMNTLETTSLDILPCKVVMVKKPLGDGTHKKKGRVVVCGNYQQVQPGEETCANTPSFPMLRTKGHLWFKFQPAAQWVGGGLDMNTVPEEGAPPLNVMVLSVVGTKF